MLDITSANATVALSVGGLFSVNLENFSADSSFTSDTVQAVVNSLHEVAKVLEFQL